MSQLSRSTTLRGKTWQGPPSAKIQRWSGSLRKSSVMIPLMAIACLGLSLGAQRLASAQTNSLPSALPSRSPSLDIRGSEVLLRRATAAEAGGQLHKALALFHEAWRLEPSLTLAMLGEGRIRETLGAWNDAEEIYTRGAAYRDLAADALKARAELRHRQERFDEALADLEDALRQRPGELSWRQILAQWSTERGNWVAALSQWRRIRDIDPKRVKPSTLAALMLLAGDADPVQAEIDRSNWVRRSIANIAKGSQR